MKKASNQFAVIGVALALVLSVPETLITTAAGQGGDPRNPKPSETPKKTSSKTATSKPTTPARKTNDAPAFSPQNPKIELVKIPPGSFMMGSDNGEPDEKPVHRVTINYSFYMGKYEVTRVQWHAVMGEGDYSANYFNFCSTCPIDGVSWFSAQSFIRRLNQLNDGYTYRLPTEAEWEYACRAGTTGDYAGDLKKMAWFSEGRIGGDFYPVGDKEPNAWGLFDMHGNAWEWCEDPYHQTYDGAPSDGSAWLSGGEQKYRVLRGASTQWTAKHLRSANRYHVAPKERYEYGYIDGYGFRVVAVARSQ